MDELSLSASWLRQGSIIKTPGTYSSRVCGSSA